MKERGFMMVTKKAAIGIGIVLVLAVVVFLVVFALSGGPSEEGVISLDGVWKIAVQVDGESISIPEKEYVVFADGVASGFQSGVREPFISSTYEIENDVLKLPGASKSYHLATHTDSCVSLYTAESSYMTIVKAENEEILGKAFDSGAIVGRWDVTYRPTSQPIVDEYLIFQDGLLSDYRNGEERPTVEAAFQWEGSVIQAPSLGIEMDASYIAENIIVLVDIHEGYVWLLAQTAGN